MYAQRTTDYAELEKLRSSKLLVYVTGDRRGLETQIHEEVLDFFSHHLDSFRLPQKISLLLYTRGGSTLVGWSIVNLIRQFCKEFEVIVPSKAHSTGTIICLGANNILMTKQATLGPIDPSVNTLLNPQIPGAGPQARVPVSVEAMRGFIELAKNEIGLKDQKEISSILVKLSESVHPLVLGEAYRAKTQIKFLARRLLSQQVTDKVKINKIIDFLCSESGSHDYTINRREARDVLGLRIEKPNDALYSLLKKIYDDIANEMELRTPYSPMSLIGTNTTLNYSFTRSLIESLSGGCDKFVTEGVLNKTKVQVAPGISKDALDDNRTFDGWRHV